ncbi:MAG: hypothetical protein LBH92_03370 [Bacteroidales bacterium]|jgi:hypothetical protein|nr:hypothetical protein [Bacteroidales bacterium]
MTNSFDFPIEILMAFGEAIKGKEEIRKWLFDNGYEHLGQLSLAISNDKIAFDWLVKHYPQFAAFDRAIDNDTDAKIWLQQNELTFDIVFADACAGKADAIAWLAKNQLDIFIHLAKIVKTDIDQREQKTSSFLPFFNANKR